MKIDHVVSSEKHVYLIRISTFNAAHMFLGSLSHYGCFSSESIFEELFYNSVLIFKRANTVRLLVVEYTWTIAHGSWTWNYSEGRTMSVTALADGS